MTAVLKIVDIRPADVTDAAADVMGDWNPHIIDFMGNPGFEWRTWCQDRNRVVPLIREPLRHYWARLFRFEQDRLKLTLQYFLNVDAKVPYEHSRRYPELKSRSQGFVAKHFGKIQGSLAPHDTYEFCVWMWEILFGEEDWHCDVEGWIVDSPAAALFR